MGKKKEYSLGKTHGFGISNPSSPPFPAPPVSAVDIIIPHIISI